MAIESTKRDITRMNEILSVLIKYGFGNFVNRDLRSKYKIFSKVAPEAKEYDSNTRLRLVFQELGTTFIKLGQTLSTFPNLVGYDMAQELAKLQEAAPVTPYSEVEEVIEDEFGKPVDEIFEDFTKEPVASASIGQVHKAFYKNILVAVKVQHPHIQETIATDIRLMKKVAPYLNNVDTLKSYNIPAIIKVFEKDMRNELNYTIEAMNAVHMKDLLKKDEVYIPDIYLEASTSRVLTMEFLDGVSLSKVFDAPDSDYDKKKIATMGADSYIKQILIYGFYHADPHPGNIFVLDRDIVAFVDFGMMGHLSNDLRDDLANLFIFISQGDAQLLTKQLYYMGIIKDKNDFNDVQDEIIHVLDRYYGAQFNDISSVMRELVESNVLKDYGVVIPRDLMMVVRTITMVYDFGNELDSSFNTTEILKPYAKKLVLNKFSPKNIERQSHEFSMDLDYISKKIPNSIMNLLNIVSDDGQIKLSLASNELDSLNNIFTRIVNELVLAIIIAAIIVGSSLILHADLGFKLFGYSALGLVGFLFSAILGGVLIILILTRGNY